MRNNICTICNVKYRRDIGHFEYPRLFVHREFKVTKKNIIPILNIAVGILSFSHVDMDYHDAIDLYANENNIDGRIYKSLHKSYCYDSTIASAEIVLIHIIFDLYFNKLEKCTGCILSMKKSIFNGIKISNDDDLEVRITGFMEKLLKKEIKKKRSKSCG